MPASLSRSYGEGCNPAVSPPDQHREIRFPREDTGPPFPATGGSRWGGGECGEVNYLIRWGGGEWGEVNYLIRWGGGEWGEVNYLISLNVSLTLSYLQVPRTPPPCPACVRSRRSAGPWRGSPPRGLSSRRLRQGHQASTTVGSKGGDVRKGRVLRRGACCWWWRPHS